MTAKARFTEIGADSMARMKLSRETCEGDAEALALLDELLTIRREPGRVFSVYLTYYGDREEQEYVMRTTSKDVIQGFCMMSRDARAALCHFFDSEMKKLKRSGLVFLPPMGDEGLTQRAMHVARADEKGDHVVTLYLSQA